MDYENTRNPETETETETGLTHLASEVLAAAAATRSGGIPLMPGADNVVVLPAGASLDDIEVRGRDLVIELADGRLFVIPDGAIFVPEIVIDGVTVPPLNLAALLTSNDPVPEAGAVRSSGGNFADPVGPIQDAYDLGDLLPYTELNFPVVERREIIPGRINRTPDVVIEDGEPATQNATDEVNEAGLPGTRPNGNVESPGSAAGNNSHSTDGTIIITSPDGLGSVTINGILVTGNAGQIIPGEHGTLVLGALQNGEIPYVYTLNDNTTGNDSEDLFTVIVTDTDGDVANASLTITIIDDVPTARNDTDDVPAATYAAQGGNVLTGVGTTSGTAGADTRGADGASVNGFHAGTTGEFSAVGSTIPGQYGILTLGADGSYTYTRNVNTPGGVSDVFTYRIADGDGDPSTATLTINIADADNEITFIPEIGEGTEVPESQLPPRGEEPEGSEFEAGPNATTGTITFVSPDGVASVSIGGTVITPGALPQTVVSNATGTLVVNAYTYDPVTGQGSITYTYTLNDNTLNTDGTTVSFPVVVTDLDGDVADDDLDIRIIDDMPTAWNDSGEQESEDASVTVNVITNDTPGADGVNLSTGVTLVANSLTGAGSVAYNGNGSFTYTPAAGEEGIVTFQYTITDGDNDPSTATVTINLLADSEPQVLSAANLTVDEDGFGNANADGAPLQVIPAETDGNENLINGGSAVANFGADVPANLLGSIALLDSPALDTQLKTLDGNFVTFAVESGALVGRDSGGGVVVTISVISAVAGPNTGDVTYGYQAVLAQPLLHTAIGTEDSVTLTGIGFEVTDSDTDTAGGSFNLTIRDDVPSLAVQGDTTVVEGATASGTWNQTIGADQPGNTTVVTLGATTVALGTPIVTANGTLTVLANGTWSFVSNNNLDNDLNPSVSFTVRVTDADGDFAEDTQTIAITDGAGPSNGGPVTLALDDQNLSDGTTPAGADFDSDVASFTAGSDALTSFAFAAGTGTLGGALSWTRVSDTLIEGRDGATLVVSLTLTPPASIAAGATGSATVTATLHNNYDSHPVFTADDLVALGAVQVVASDHDGDTTSVSVNVTVSDDVPSLTMAATDPVTSLTATGDLTLTVGADRVTGSNLDTYVNVSLSSGTVGGQPITITSVNPLPSSTNTPTVVTYSFAFTYDSDPIAAGNQAVANSGTITLNTTTGEYSVTIANPVGTSSTVQTNQAIARVGYDNEDNPGVSSGDEVTVSQLSSNFFVQFSGEHNAFAYSGGSNGRFSGNPSYVSISGNSNGVASDTIQQNDVLNMNFFTTDPGGDLSNPTETKAMADAVFFQIDGFGNDEDALIVLALVDPNNPNTIIYRTFQADNADFFTNGDLPIPGYNFTLDNNDAVLIIEANDYRLPSDPVPYVIVGIQYVVSSEGTSGLAYDLNGAVGVSGGITDITANAFVDNDITDDNDVTKITNIGFKLTTAAAQPLTLNFSTTVTDDDGDVVTTPLTVTFPASVMPVVLDMGGDGVEFLDQSAGVSYDYNGDGVAEVTGWAGAHDAILVRDWNGNGTVDDASEFVFGGSGLTDLQALAAQYGSALDANDADFGKFGVWQDANSNGAVDAGELQSLTAAGIASINLVSDGVSYSAANGSVLVHGEGSFTWADGSTGILADASFVTGPAVMDALLSSATASADGQSLSELPDIRVAFDDTLGGLTIDAVVDHFAATDATPLGSLIFVDAVGLDGLLSAKVTAEGEYSTPFDFNTMLEHAEALASAHA